MSGDLVVEEFAFDRGRSVSVYVPARPPEAIVFAGDGATIAAWGPVLDEVVSTMIVGIH